MSTPSLESLRARRGEILAIAQRRGASDVRVFGSVAGRGSDSLEVVGLPGIAVDSTSLYWTEGSAGSGSVVKLTPK